MTNPANPTRTYLKTPKELEAEAAEALAELEAESKRNTGTITREARERGNL